MATTTGKVLRQRLSEAMADYYSLTPTSGSTSTIVDADLLNLPGGGDTDGFENQFCLLLNDPPENRRIKSYATGTTTITVESVYAANDGTTAVEIHKINPDWKQNAINRAIEDLFPILYLPIRDETLVVDDLLTNSGFESTYSSGHPSWTDVNSPTSSAETTRVFHGAQSAKLISHASTGAGQMTQDLVSSVNIDAVAGKSTTFKAWVWSATADEARIRIDWDGTDFANSAYHQGSSQWQLLEASGAVPKTATKIMAICEVIVGTKTAYFDRSYLAIDSVHNYTIPTTIIHGPHFVSQQYNENNPTDPYYPLRKGGRPTQGRLLRLEGMGLLSRPTTETGTTEVAEPKVSLIVAQAAMWLNRSLASMPNASSAQRKGYQDDMVMWGEEVSRLLGQPGVRMVPMGTKMSKNIWHIEEDSSGRYLVFDRVRNGVVSL